MKIVSKVKLSRKAHEFMFFDDLEKLIFTNPRGRQAIVYDLTTKKNERLYNFGSDFVTTGMRSSDFFSVSGTFKTFICKISDDLYYECPIEDLFCWNVYEDRYFVFYKHDRTEAKGHRLFCCDSLTGEFTEIGLLRFEKFDGLYFIEESSKCYKGSDRLNTKEMCLEFNLEELKFEGVESFVGYSVYEMAGLYVVLLEKESEDSTLERIHVFDEDSSLIKKIHFVSPSKYIQVSVSSDRRTINVAAGFYIMRFDIITGKLISEQTFSTGYSYALFGDFYQVQHEEYLDNINGATYKLARKLLLLGYENERCTQFITTGIRRAKKASC